jgi:hypothetical protein
VVALQCGARPLRWLDIIPHSSGRPLVGVIIGP